MLIRHVAYFRAGQTMDGEPNAQMINFYGAIMAFVTDVVVTVLVTLVTRPKPVSELAEQAFTSWAGTGVTRGGPRPERRYRVGSDSISAWGGPEVTGE